MYENSSDHDLNSLAMAIIQSDNPVEFAANELRKLADPAIPGESVKAVLWRLRRKLPTLSSARIRAIWYRDSRVRISLDEAKSIIGATKTKCEVKDELVQERDELAREVERLRLRIEKLEQYLLGQEAAASGATFEPLCTPSQ